MFYSVFGPKTYLGINMFCYFMALVLLLMCARINPPAFEKLVDLSSEDDVKKGNWQLSKTQWRAFMALPALSALGSVLMSLSPSFGMNQANYVLPVLGLSLSPVLMLLFSRCLGQIIGPFIVPRAWFKNLSSSKLLKVITLSAFFALYAAAFYVEALLLKCFLIILAHVFSNVFYVLGMYVLQSHFRSEEIGRVATRQYQINLLLMIFCPLVSGALAPVIGFVPTAAIFLGLVLCSLLAI
jgi:hypothetical protein